MKEKIKEASYWKEKYQKALLKRAKDIKLDSEKEERIKNLLCEICYYKNDILAGQAITKRHCLSCDKEETFPSTYTNKICEQCAKKHSCCKHCLAMI